MQIPFIYGIRSENSISRAISRTAARRLGAGDATLGMEPPAATRAGILFLKTTLYL